jgi:hypothetical protein
MNPLKILGRVLSELPRIATALEALTKSPARRGQAREHEPAPAPPARAAAPESSPVPPEPHVPQGSPIFESEHSWRSPALNAHCEYCGQTRSTAGMFCPGVPKHPL